jgi:drug/metabolite transporter (DMT)-like permease
MLISNALVWRFFVRGLHTNDESALIPTIISTAANFCVSGLCGCIIFHETTSLMWWIGAIMIFCGLYLVISEKSSSSSSSSSSKVKAS